MEVFLKELKAKIGGLLLPIEKQEGIVQRLEEVAGLVYSSHAGELERVANTFRELRRQVRAEFQEGETGIAGEVIDALGVAETFVSLRRVRESWESWFLPGVKDVRAIEREGRAFLLIELSPGAKKLGYQDQQIELKREKLAEAQGFVPGLKEKLKGGGYPSLEDSRKIWDLIAA